MTTFEHALLGMNGLLATGLQRRFGWKLAVLASVAAIAPDWDGVPMLFDMSRFEVGHRVWGHNLLACCLLGLCLATIDYRVDLVGRAAKSVTRWGPLRELASSVDVRQSFSRSVWFVWVLVAIVAALSQIPADAVVSGAEGLSDWALKPLWPFSDFTWIYPMIPWGNVGVTIIFAIAMIMQVKQPIHVQSIAITALVSVVVYLCVWSSLFPR
ncbi:MAG: metal-dependent hydrolase [Rubripirellula sp.]